MVLPPTLTGTAKWRQKWATGDPSTGLIAHYLSAFDAVDPPTPNNVAQVIAAVGRDPVRPFSCASFPCARLTHLDKRYRTKYGMRMLGNLESIRKFGVRYFIRAVSVLVYVDLESSLCEAPFRVRRFPAEASNPERKSIRKPI
jgi:hypothetical protein